MTKKFKWLPLLFAKAAVSISLLWLVLSKIDVQEVIENIKDVNIVYLFPAVALFGVGLLLSAKRWQILGYKLFTYGKSLKYTLISVFYSALLPGTISGDIMKGGSLALKEKQMRTRRLPLSIFMDKLIGFLAILCFYIISNIILYFTNADAFKLFQFTFLIGIIVSILLIILLITVTSSTLGNKARTLLDFINIIWMRSLFERLQASFFYYSDKKRIILKAFFVGILLHLFNIVQNFLIIYSLGYTVGVLQITIFYSLLSVLLMMPVSISGIGLRDIFAAFFFQRLSIASDTAIAFSWLLLFITLIFAFIGGISLLCETFTSRKND